MFIIINSIFSNLLLILFNFLHPSNYFKGLPISNLEIILECLHHAYLLIFDIQFSKILHFLIPINFLVPIFIIYSLSLLILDHPINFKEMNFIFLQYSFLPLTVLHLFINYQQYPGLLLNFILAPLHYLKPIFILILSFNIIITNLIVLIMLLPLSFQRYLPLYVKVQYFIYDLINHDTYHSIVMHL